MAWAAAGAVVLASISGWLWWARRYPYRDCHWCGGKGCRICQGTGQIRRPLAALTRRIIFGKGGRHGR